jgi:CrcB protein
MPEHSMWLRIAVVAVAGATGAATRFATDLAVHSFVGGRETWHWGTLAVNVIGCFAFGAIVVSVSPKSLWAIGALTGFIGAYTTFSSLIADTHNVYAAGATPNAGITAAAANLALHVVLGMGAFVAGMALGRWWA